MNPIEIALSGERGKRENNGMGKRYIVSTYVNVKMFLPIQLSYANKILKVNFKKGELMEAEGSTVVTRGWEGR
jgi:hypothetical protein